MSLNSKVQIPDSSWGLTGDAVLVGDEIKIDASAIYEDDFESYSIGQIPNGWIPVTGTFNVQNQGGQKCARLSNPGLWMGAYYNSADFSAGCLVMQCVHTAGGRFNSVLGFDPAGTKGYLQQFSPGLEDSMYIGGTPANFVGAANPKTIARAHIVENPATPFLLKRHKYVKGDGSVEMRGWINDELKYDILDIWAKWGANKLGLQGYSGDSYYGFVKFYEIETGGFNKIFTPYSITKLSRVGFVMDKTASIRKNLSELLEYNVDGGAWNTIPDDGFIDVAATTNFGIRANDTFQNDFDASGDLALSSLNIEIDGLWDAPVGVPDAPTSIAAKTLSHFSARVSWIDSVTPSVIYNKIYKNTSADFGTAQLVGFALQGQEYADIGGLDSSTQYWFWVLAVDSGGGSSAPVGPVDITTYSKGAALDLVSIEKALYDWAVRNSNYTVVWLYESGPKPAKPFISLNLVGPHKIGTNDNLGVPEGETELKIRGQRKFSVSVNVYGDTSTRQDASDLQTSLDLPGEIETLNVANIGIGEIRNVIDLTQLLDTKYEHRAQFDFDIFTGSSLLAPVETIEQAPTENKILED